MKKRVFAMMIAGVTVLGTIGCGAQEDKDSTDRARTEDSGEEDEETDEEEESDPEVPAGKEEEQSVADRLCGDWNYVCLQSGYSEGGISEITNFAMAEDESLYNRYISFYYDGDELYADYRCSDYEWGIAGFHLPVTIEEGTLYDDCTNTEWYVSAQHPEKEEVGFKATLTGENELTGYEEYNYSYDDSDYTYFTVTTYLREGSEESLDSSDYRYFTTVEVSTVDELAAAIADHTKIILNAGVYNFSELQQMKETENFKFDADEEPYIDSIEHLKLEAKDGAYVEICTDSAVAPVLSLQNSSFVRLDGITFGHRVPPGGCSGSVLRTENVYDVDVDNCKLYGSGIYGLEAYNSNQVSFNHSEIFECTFGITELIGCYGIAFKNCEMYNNSDSNMFWIYSCSDVTVTGCEIHDNTVASSGAPYDGFVWCNDDCYRIRFERCDFRNNSYGDFAYSDAVETQGCKFDDQ